MFHFRLISLTMPQGNVAEPACDAVAYFASPLSASECGLAKHGHSRGMIERAVASAATTMALTQTGKWQGVTGNPMGEILAGGTTGSLRSQEFLDYVLSGGNDGREIATGIAGALGADVYLDRGWSRLSTKQPQSYQYGLQQFRG